MTYKTHLVGGAVAAMLLTLAASEQELGLKPFTTPEFFGVLTASLLGSLAPDIDQGKKSKAGAMVKPVASVCSKCFGHRTFLPQRLVSASAVLYYPWYLSFNGVFRSRVLHRRCIASVAGLLQPTRRSAFLAHSADFPFRQC